MSLLLGVYCIQSRSRNHVAFVFILCSLYYSLVLVSLNNITMPASCRRSPEKVSLLYEVVNYCANRHQKQSLRTFSLRAHFYPVSGSKAESVSVPTVEAGGLRYPLVEAFLTGEGTQPWIHDCTVKVSRRGRQHQFRVFYKNHKLLEDNTSLPCGTVWKGDILVLRKGVELFGVNLRAKDANLIDYVVSR